MDPFLSNALIRGYESMVAWSDLLDQINVFPVADGDTGRNLKISLAPLRRLGRKSAMVPHAILRNATGNAGNIAAAFFCEVLAVKQLEMLSEAVDHGVRRAYHAVADPQPGTMLTVLEALAQALPAATPSPGRWPLETIVAVLEESVADTSDTLPQIRQAGVVDAGALGMFIFLEAFLGSLAGRVHQHRTVIDRFHGKLKILDQWQPDHPAEQYCVSAVIRPQGESAEARRRLVDWGQSVVVNQDDDQLKVHLHTEDCDSLQTGLAQIGQVIHWNEEKIDIARPTQNTMDQPVHVMTDAAGSVTPADARALGMTLLDSYLVVGEQAIPETLYDPATLYAAMAGGQKVSTAQTSVFQRHQSYLSAVSRFEQVLYLCVGSVYTGNYETAAAWQTANDPGRCLTIIDSGAASGRLGIAALATARHARQGHSLGAVAEFAQAAAARSQEYIFLDQLKFLAAGGRISRTRGFFGDLLHMKPIITPTAQGAAKVGVVRNRQEQLAFALERLDACFQSETTPLILVQYSDNRSWVDEMAVKQIQSLLPTAEILLRPLSLTSGAHMGPGTWAVAFLPGIFNP